MAVICPNINLERYLGRRSLLAIAALLCKSCPNFLPVLQDTSGRNAAAVPFVLEGSDTHVHIFKDAFGFRPPSIDCSLVLRRVRISPRTSSAREKPGRAMRSCELSVDFSESSQCNR